MQAGHSKAKKHFRLYEGLQIDPWIVQKAGPR